MIAVHLLASFVRARIVRHRITWHAWRAGRTQAAMKRHASQLLALAAAADRELDRLDRLAGR